MQWDLTEWPIPKIKAWFRGLVVAHMIFVIGGYLLPIETFLGTPQDPIGQNYSREAGWQVPGWLLWTETIHWSLLVLEAISMIGMLLIHSWGRRLFTLVFFTHAISSPFTGLSLWGGPAALSYGLSLTTAGILLCLAHTSPVRDLMSPDWDEPTE